MGMTELTVERFEEGMESFAKIVKEGFDAVDQRFDAVEFVIRSNHEEVKGGNLRLDGRIDRLADHVDAFIQLHQKLDIELTALRHKYDLLATRVAKLEGAPA